MRVAGMPATCASMMANALPGGTSSPVWPWTLTSSLPSTSLMILTRCPPALGFDRVLGLAILFVPRELAVELLAQLLDVSGGVFKAAEVFSVCNTINSYAGLICALGLPNPFNAGRIVA